MFQSLLYFQFLNRTFINEGPLKLLETMLQITKHRFLLCYFRMALDSMINGSILTLVIIQGFISCLMTYFSLSAVSYSRLAIVNANKGIVHIPVSRTVLLISNFLLPLLSLQPLLFESS